MRSPGTACAATPFLVLALVACQQAAALPPVAAAATAPVAPVPVETLFEGGLREGWKDYGWAPRQLATGGPAQLDLSRHGGWIVAHPGLSGRFGGLVFRLQAPADWGDFLEVRVDSTGSRVFPRVRPGAAHRTDVGSGWVEVFIPMAELNPAGAPFDRVVLRAFRSVGDTPVLLDRLALTQGDGRTPLAQPFPVRMHVDCAAEPRAISPLIYGIAYDPRLDASHKHQWELGTTARRWGGNSTSRYNWRLGNAWNTANDWFFRNVNFTGDPGYTWERFLDDNQVHGVGTTLTVPMLGWVAKDRESVGFPVAVYGAQRRTDPYRSHAGDGYRPDGKPVTPTTPSITSTPMPPSEVGRWVAAIRARDAQRGVRSVQSWILDNEPALWNSTHRDVHPDPLTYDELLERTLKYGAAVREADPEGLIAGPAEWGWPGYFFSAADSEAGFRLKPDRRAHGDVPLLDWYLRQLRDHERRTGQRLLDIVDVHFYPQVKGLKHGTGGATDEDTNALRLRATRALWDPTYVDESWIGEAVRLIPRLQEIIDREYPGRRISLGEWSFGAENHPSGGLALAEALGRFGQHGVYSAYYWTYPAKESFGFWAFRAFRNYDGRGGRFLDYSLPARSEAGASLFASRDAEGKRLVLVVLNLDPLRPAAATIDVGSCGVVGRRIAYAMGAEQPGLREEKTVTGERHQLAQELAPYSLNVFELELTQPLSKVLTPSKEARP